MKLKAAGVFILLLAAGFFYISFINLPSSSSVIYEAATTSVAAVKSAQAPMELTGESETRVVTHIKTPQAVKAIYMTSWVASTPALRSKLVALIDETELNAVVIDIKDYTGKIAFEVKSEELREVGSAERRIRDIDEFIEELHRKNIYVIGRVAVFQDPYYVSMFPEEAVKRKSDGKIWKDRKGLSFIDAGSEKSWKYMVAIGKEAYTRGFDEINYDYIRFPSDGNMTDIDFPFMSGRSKSEVIEDFFKYLHEEFKNTGIITSADLFGMTTVAVDDMNIGQILEKTLPYFDYVAPMVYPSHYPPGYEGFKNPAEKPYEIIKSAMQSAVDRAEAMGISPLKLRPWLQDFDLGATYTPEMIRAQIKATYDVGLTSWMLWDPSNTYTRPALLEN
jgi:hypothetical protein